MTIEATEPSTLTGAIYDKWAIAEFWSLGDGCVPLGGGPAQPIQVKVRLVKARVLDDGITWERSPFPGDYRLININDLYAILPTYPSFGPALQALEQAVQDYAAAQGKL